MKYVAHLVLMIDSLVSMSLVTDFLYRQIDAQTHRDDDANCLHTQCKERVNFLIVEAYAIGIMPLTLHFI